MVSSSDKKTLLFLFFVLFFIIISTYIISVFARGYQLTYRPGVGLSFRPTGLVSLSSRPKGASVYINHRLLTATDNVLNLPPGNYHLKIVKDGYFPWSKEIKIKKELVFQADIDLFRSTPDLKAITFSGAIHPTVSPDGQKIIYSVASASASVDNGLYLLDITSPILPLSRNLPRQLAPNFATIDWSQASFVFSPDSKMVLAQFHGFSFLLDLSQTISYRQLYDVTPRLPLITSEWNKQEQAILTAKLNRLPLFLKTVIATQSAAKFQFASDDNRLFYLSALGASLPPSAWDDPKQTREIKPNLLYTYDLKKDANYLLGHPADFTQLSWIPNSSTLLFIKQHHLNIIESDGTNQQILFTGNFSPVLACPWPDGAKVIILTSAYSAPQENLYTVSLR
jgi:hypothetical protein